MEFLAARYGMPPWEMERVPMILLNRWFPAAMQNVQDEGALGLGAALGKIFK